MPLKECQINNQPGWKWGDEGKCYTGPNGKEKAIKQGIAIGEGNKLEKLNSLRETLSNVKISFDYDGTLTQPKYQQLLAELIKAGGNTIYIISARDNASSMYYMANKLGIPMSRVYGMGSNEKKIEKIKELGISKHYDNNPDVVNALPGIGKLVK